MVEYCRCIYRGLIDCIVDEKNDVIHVIIGRMWDNNGAELVLPT